MGIPPDAYRRHLFFDKGRQLLPVYHAFVEYCVSRDLFLTDLRVLWTLGGIASIRERPTIISALSAVWPGVPGHIEIPELALPPSSRSLATNLSI